MTLGVRDSRKIVGKYHLTGKDCITQAKFKDSIGIFPEFIDGYNILVFKLVCGRREERNGVREELCKKSHKKVLLLTFDCSADVSWNIWYVQKTTTIEMTRFTSPLTINRINT